MLSVIVPARGEGELTDLITELSLHLWEAQIRHEIIVSRDDGEPHGYGLAIRRGLARSRGDIVAIVMADGSDTPSDLVDYYRIVSAGYDCAFGTRFYKGHYPKDYPWPKLILNRIANHVIMWMFGLYDNDVTNAFKCYRREIIEKMAPLISEQFDLTVEMPLKAYLLGAKVAHPPISWTQRKEGRSKWKISELGSKYVRCIIRLWWWRYVWRREWDGTRIPTT